MQPSVAIIGAGWYGCHIGTSLRGLGFDVTVFEQHDRALHEASGNNQFRLHLGFHYPRHHATRIQSRDGFNRFIERYPRLSREVRSNIYAVPSEDSLIDFLTYRLIMTSSGIEFQETRSPEVPLAHIDGALLVGERVLLIETARRYFADRLGAALRLGCRAEHVVEETGCVRVNGERFDVLVDATWGHFSRPLLPVIYEPTVLFYYELPANFPAVTLVDGPLCSVYPTETPGLYTLSSVPHTPLGQFATAAEARAARDSAAADTLAAKSAAMEAQIGKYLPAFRDAARPVGVQLAIKTKPIGRSDDRSCTVTRRGRVFSVMSGKIDTIFFAVERILAVLESGADLAEP